MRKRFLVLMLAIVAVFFLLTMSSSAASGSGKCGENVTWTLTEDGVLTISGNGAMTDYAARNAPWYSMRNDIQTLVIDPGVTMIGNYAFFRCVNLQSSQIPDSVAGIGSYAFAQCSSLTSILLPDSITSIGKNAFWNCSSATKAILPNSLTTIGEGVFMSCGFSEIEIPESVIRIDDAAFNHCQNLTSIVIPQNVTQIGVSTFQDCISLKTLTFGYGLTTISHNAFNNCSSLTKVSLPGKLTSIGIQSFANCTSLKTVSLPTSLTSIGNAAFDHCTSLLGFYMSGYNSNYSVQNGVLFDRDKKTLLKYPAGKQGDYQIPYTVTTIDQSAFSECSGLTGVAFPASTTSIGSRAFSNCTGLTELNLRGSIKSIDGGAFQGCSSLTSVTVPGSVTYLGLDIFADCTNLKTATLSEGVFWVPSGMFENCTALREVSMPSSASSIGSTVFLNCTSLTSVVIPDRVTSIARAAFQGCTSLTEVKVPASTKTISESVFDGCDALTDVFYDGYEAQWKEITIEGNNDPLNDARLHFKESSLTILVHPTDCSTTANTTAAFSVSAEGDGLTYQWQYNNPASGVWKNNSSATKGYNTDTLTVEATAARNGYQYRCVVTDANGTTVTSDPATLSVLSIKTQPKNASVVGTSSANFKVSATGADLTYQWQYKNPATGVWKNCSSATKGYNTATLTVQGVTGSTNRNGYQYRCVVKDAAGNKLTSKAVTLTVFAIKTQPKDASTSGSAKASFKMAATGTDLTYQWQYKNPANGVWKNCSAATEGYNTATLKVAGTTGKTNRNGYQYRCIVTSGDNALVTNAVTLTVK